MKTITNIIYPALAALAFACLAVSPGALAVTPAPDGCYPGFTTAEGCGALASLTSGHNNTATGAGALQKTTTGGANTATGSGALLNNTTGNFNVANGYGALFQNTTGFNNTANGAGRSKTTQLATITWPMVMVRS